MQAEATDLIEEGGRVVGVRAKTPDGELEIRADLVVGCRRPPFDRARERRLQGRRSRRADGRALVPPVAQGRATAARPFGHIEAGMMMVMLNRGDYWQCAYVIPKGGIDARQGEGPRRFRDSVARHVAVPARPLGELEELGRRQAADRRGRPAARTGIGRACCASATPRTRCRRSAASASISPSRTRSPRRTFWPRRLREGRVTEALLDAVQAAAHHADARHPVDAAADSEPRAVAACWHGASGRSRPLWPGFQLVPAAAADSGAAHRPGRAAGARAGRRKRVSKSVMPGTRPGMTPDVTFRDTSTAPTARRSRAAMAAASASYCRASPSRRGRWRRSPRRERSPAPT